MTHRMLELAILGLLKEQPMHGYQLSRELGESLGGFWRVSYGSLYPSLRRLEKEGAVESVPSDEERGGRRKNVYRVTEKGEKLFFELLQETPHDNSTEDTRFRVRLAFFKYLPPETRIRLLERRRALLEDRLSTIKDSLRATRERVDDYTLALMEHGRNATESDIAWLDGLIEAERHRSDGSTAGGERSVVKRRFAERSAPHEQGPFGDRGCGQLRLVARAGTRVLQGREPGRPRARADARGSGWLPRRRHRGRRRVRRGREEGRHGCGRSDLLRAEQHDPVRGRRAAPRASWCSAATRSTASAPTTARRSSSPSRSRSTWRRSCATRRPTCS